MRDQFIKIINHHRGSFVRNEYGSLTYCKERISELSGLDTDTLDVFSVRDYYKHLGFDKVEQCRWLVPNMPLTTGLRTLTHDDEMQKCASMLGETSELLGLIPALREVIPNAHHRFCVWHLWKNFNKQWKDNELRGLLWEYARSTTQEGWIEGMRRIKRLNEEAWSYLSKWPKNAWSRAFFSNVPNMDNICNNAFEIFNSQIKGARAKPIITLLEEVRMYAMRTIRNKVKLRSHIGILPPIQHSWLEKIRKESKRMPCVHACAALARVGKRPDEFCHKWLTMDAYNETYAFHLNPIPG
ncbi:uncharacterized protein [Arachis hypogaea]|uniref:uncharacterized protein n=1 Tax=Arachis hypogaea TaxID=3818 RepID=UPI003B212F14